MATIINQYKIYCNTEQKFVSGFGSELPTTCYNDHAHEVNPNSSILINVVETKEVIIKEETIKTGGNFTSECIYEGNILPNDTTIITKSWKIPLNILNIDFQFTDENVGDSFECYVNPDFKVGVTTDECKSGATTVSASHEIITSPYIFIGYEISLSDGKDHTEELGVITELNNVNNTITFETPVTTTFASGSEILLSCHIIKNFHIVTSSGCFKIGEKRLGGLYLPANVACAVYYTNNSGQTKKLSALVEYLY